MKVQYPTQMLEPPQPSPFNVKGKQLYSKFFQDDGAPHLSKAETGHSLVESGFQLLGPGISALSQLLVHNNKPDQHIQYRGQGPDLFIHFPLYYHF